MFNQRVHTPKGQAILIGSISETNKLIVARMVPATELSKEECIHRKPVIAEWTQIDFINWQRSAKFCINEIYDAQVVQVHG